LDTLERVPPHSLEAEASVLGAILLDNEAAHYVAQILRPEHLYSPRNRLIYKVILDLLAEGKPADPVLIREELSKRGELEKAGGAAYLLTLTESVPSIANVEQYAKIVRDKALGRGLIQVCVEIVDDAYAGEGSTEALLDRAERKFFEAVERRVSSPISGLKDLITEALEKLEAEKPSMGIETHLVDMDQRLFGLHPSELIILAARPSMGKSSLATTIVRNVGIRGSSAVALFSLEVSKGQVAQNMLCAEARVDNDRLRRHLLERDERLRIRDAACELAEANIFIDDTATLSTMELRAKARRLKLQHDIKLIVIDYLQLMDSGVVKDESRQLAISTISRSLKSLARELNVPVIALSQLSRQVEAREGHIPRLSDLRESGSLEQDADVVLLLYREAYYAFEKQERDKRQSESRYTDDEDGGAGGGGPPSRSGRNRGFGGGGGGGGAAASGAARAPAVLDPDFLTTAKVIIAKNRHGPTGDVKLRFFGQFLSFDNHAPMDYGH
jgi:replicative DNA helicase